MGGVDVRGGDVLRAGGGLCAGDDPNWESSYGGKCETYGEGAENAGYCSDDEACGACPCSCAHECTSGGDGGGGASDETYSYDADKAPPASDEPYQYEYAYDASPSPGTQFTCFTSTKVQILTETEAACRRAGSELQ